MCTCVSREHSRDALYTRAHMKHHLTALRYLRSCVSRRGVRITTFLLVFFAQYLSRLFSTYHMPLPSEGCDAGRAFEDTASVNAPPHEIPRSYDPLTLAYDSLLYQSLFNTDAREAGDAPRGIDPKTTQPLDADEIPKAQPLQEERITMSRLRHLVHIHAKYLCIFLGLWTPGYLCSRKSACALQWSIASAMLSCCFICYFTCVLAYRTGFGNEDTPLALSAHMGMQLLNSYSAFIRVTPEIHTFQWVSLGLVTALLKGCILLYTVLTPFDPAHLFFNTVVSLILLEGQRIVFYFPITTMPILLFDARDD